MIHRPWLISTFLLLLAASNLQAAEWRLLGSSDAGRYFVDSDSIAWNQDRTAFSLMTNVIQKDNSEWLITLKIDCKTETFIYMDGREFKNDALLASFDAPRPAEKILPQSMPYQLSEEYCSPVNTEVQHDWQSIGSSKISSVFFDRSTLRKNKEGTRFIADTKVVPFDNSEETWSTMSFDCDKGTFTLLKMSKLKDGVVEHIFDKPQPATSIDKTATLASLAGMFCTQKPECAEVSSKLKSIESAIQADYEGERLSCKSVKASIEQVQALEKKVKKYHCRITGLDGYTQQLKEASCK